MSCRMKGRRCCGEEVDERKGRFSSSARSTLVAGGLAPPAVPGADVHVTCHVILLLWSAVDSRKNRSHIKKFY